LSKLLSLIYFVHFFATAAVLMVTSAFLFPFTYLLDRKRRLLHYLASAWGYHFVQSNRGWRCHFDGLEHFDRNSTYVVIANHQSLADIFILSGLNRPFKWVSKQSLFKIPFFGWNMFFTGYVAIKRGDMSSIKKMIADCRAWLLKGESILMFPEGTRSEDGNLQKFRDGSFKLATDTQVPILPIVIDGTRKILPKHGRTLAFNADINVKILPPISPAVYGNNHCRMREYVQQLMQNTLTEMRTSANESTAINRLFPRS
jgi:1-acyl-sn-glycerol-3-phosphate acyltransferase